tara:strand:+ start:1164 stop:1394 length:231 start_codon:yes stop_codon:yes gene_type:complete
MDSGGMSDYEYAVSCWPKDEDIVNMAFKNSLNIKNNKKDQQLYIEDTDGQILCEGNPIKIEGFLYGYDAAMKKGGE